MPDDEPTAAPAARAGAADTIDSIIQDVAELPDRSSPENWPDAMLVTADELRSILAERLGARGEHDAATPGQPSRELGDMNIDPEWLMRMAEKEGDGCFSVGGMAVKMRWPVTPEQVAALSAAPGEVERLRRTLEAVRNALAIPPKSGASSEAFGDPHQLQRYIDGVLADGALAATAPHPASTDGLAAEVAALRSRTAWVPVTERTPEPWERVLTWGTGGYAFDRWTGEHGSVPHVFEEADFEDYTVTHWMPLPAPPSGGGHAKGGE